MDKIVVLLSGGLASAVTGFWAAAQFGEVYTVAVDAGHTEAKAIERAEKLANIITKGNADRHLELDDSGDLVFGGGSTDDDIGVVNLIYLALAANVGLSKGCNNIAFGSSKMTPKYRQAAEDAIGLELHERTDTFRIHNPLAGRTDEEIIAFARELPGCVEALVDVGLLTADQALPDTVAAGGGADEPTG